MVSLSGIDIDKTPTSIGSGIRKFRSPVSTYSAQEMEDWMSKPWISWTKHVVLPSEEEVIHNPRARSAKLRAAAKA